MFSTFSFFYKSIEVLINKCTVKNHNKYRKRDLQNADSAFDLAKTACDNRDFSLAHEKFRDAYLLYQKIETRSLQGSHDRINLCRKRSQDMLDLYNAYIKTTEAQQAKNIGNLSLAIEKYEEAGALFRSVANHFETIKYNEMGSICLQLAGDLKKSKQNASQNNDHIITENAFKQERLRQLEIEHNIKLDFEKKNKDNLRRELELANKKIVSDSIIINDMKRTINILEEEKKELEKNRIETPDEYMCPITLNLMSDPVICADGFSYERSAIERWFQKNDTSPKTTNHIPRDLIPNTNLRKLIEAWKSNDGIP